LRLTEAAALLPCIAPILSCRISSFGLWYSYVLVLWCTHYRTFSPGPVPPVPDLREGPPLLQELLPLPPRGRLPGGPGGLPPGQGEGQFLRLVFGESPVPFLQSGGENGSKSGQGSPIRLWQSLPV